MDQNKFRNRVEINENYQVVIKAGEDIVLTTDEELDQMAGMIRSAKEIRRDAKRAFNKGNSLMNAFNGNGGNGNGSKGVSVPARP